MNHYTTPKFWERYHDLPDNIQKQADKAFELLKNNPEHPSLHFKKVGAFWSARIDISHRALAVKDKEGFVWVWIGSHRVYEQLIRKR